MPARDARPSFNAGEISPDTDARFDLSKFSAACEVLENFAPMPTGGARKLPGSVYLAETKNSGDEAGRLVPFRFSTGTNYVLLFEAGSIRFFSNRAAVLDGGSPYEVSNPYTESQLFELHFAQLNDVVYVTHPDVAPYKLSRFGDTNWTFEEVEWDYPPFLAQNPSPDVSIDCSATTGTGATLTVTGTAWAHGPTYFTVGKFRENGGSIYKCVENHTSTASFAADLASGYWELVEVFTSDNVGGYFELQHPRDPYYAQIGNLDSAGSQTTTWLKVRGTVSFFTTGTWDGDLDLERSYDAGSTNETIMTWVSRSDFNGETSITFDDTVWLRWNYTRNAATGYANPRAVIEPQALTASGTVKVTAVASATSATADVVIDLEATTATDAWSEGAWSSRRGFPASLTFHEQRLCFGGTSHQAQTVWLSGTGDFEDFRKGIGADDSFSISVGSRNYNGIKWLESKDRLMVGTTGGEFAVKPASDSSPLGPTNVSIQNNTNYGSTAIQPVLINESVLYVARANEAVMELSVDYVTEKLVSPELSLLATHITEDGIAQMDAQRGRWATLWAVSDDGYLAGMTYERSQDVVAWFKKKTADGDTIESVATVYGTTDDEVWMVVKRADGDSGGYVRTVEYFDVNAWDAQDSGDPSGTAFVDSAVIHDGAATTTITIPSFLVGRELAILADGAVLERQTPDSTTVTIDDSASTIVVGLPVAAKIQPTRPEIGLQSGSSSGSKKRISTVCVKLRDSGYVNVYQHTDTSLTRPCLVTAHTSGETEGTAPPLLTGVYRVAIPGNWEREPGYTLISDAPLPCTVLGLTHEFTVGQRT